MRVSRMSSVLAVSILALAMSVGLSGCVFLDSSGSFSDSSGSVSDSSGSGSQSSESSSGSSSGGSNQAYREDVRDLAIAIARLDQQPEALRRGISELALARGISDWEAVAMTYAAVGEGLGQVGVTEAQLLAYQTALARPGTADFDAIGEGYEASRP